MIKESLFEPIPLARYHLRIAEQEEAKGRVDEAKQCRETAENVREFLRRFPKLRPAPKAWWDRFPCHDHSFFWTTKTRQYPIVLTTFPYRPAVDTDAMQRFAFEYGFRLEIDPGDVPDMWFPGQTIPVVWSKLDWRSLGRGFY